MSTTPRSAAFSVCGRETSTANTRVTQSSGGKLACAGQWVTGWPLPAQPSTSSPALSSGSEEGSRWSEEKPRLLPGSASRILATQPSKYVYWGEKMWYQPTIQWASPPEWELSVSEHDFHIRDPDGVMVKGAPEGTGNSTCKVTKSLRHLRWTAHTDEEGTRENTKLNARRQEYRYSLVSSFQIKFYNYCIFISHYGCDF